MLGTGSRGKASARGSSLQSKVSDPRGRTTFVCASLSKKTAWAAWRLLRSTEELDVGCSRFEVSVLTYPEGKVSTEKRKKKLVDRRQDPAARSRQLETCCECLTSESWAK